MWFDQNHRAHASGSILYVERPEAEPELRAEWELWNKCDLFFIHSKSSKIVRKMSEPVADDVHKLYKIYNSICGKRESRATQHITMKVRE